jgi:hypothetical protein
MVLIDLLLLSSVIPVTACASVGPGSITRDRFDYTAAVAETEKEQLLRNIVRLRYLDAPTFVRVDSMINQYGLEGTVSLDAGWNTSVIGEDTQVLGGTGRWMDRPTITYTPVAGRAFAQNLMTPIPPDALLALVQSGWSGEFLFRLGVRSINRVDNEMAAVGMQKPADPEFKEVLDLWSRLLKARVLGLRRDDSEATVRIYGYIDENRVASEHAADVARMRDLLGLDPSETEFKISYGLVADEANEIALLTSSILEIMTDLAWRVDAPGEHVEAGRTLAGHRSSGLFDQPLFEVRNALDAPEEAYVAVRERGYWFYIEDDDLVSKRTFAILQVLLSLTESSGGTRGPVVTIGG